MATSELNSINAKSVFVEPMGIRQVEVTVNDIDPDEVLDCFDAQEAVDHFGEDTLLDLIGRDKAIEYWKIEEA